MLHSTKTSSREKTLLIQISPEKVLPVSNYNESTVKNKFVYQNKETVKEDEKNRIILNLLL